MPTALCIHRAHTLTVVGKPTCRHCGEVFVGWQYFQLAYHDAGHAHPLRQDRELCDFLTQRCILCGFWSA